MVESEIQRIRSKGIYHGLPVFPDDVKGLTAIVVGANGISGDHMLRVLCESPHRWTKIYAVSRRPPNGEWPSHVEHVSMDLLQSPEVLAEQMKERGVIGADYAFFFAYIQPKAETDGGSIWSAAEKLVEVNTRLLSNFLEGLALSATPTTPLPKRILLQTGAKYYGVHLGPAPTPQEETDPRVPTTKGSFEPNFYYNQEDYLIAFARKHGIGWNTTRPSWVPGAVPDAAMNLCYPLAVYATVQRHLGKPLEYPVDLAAWETNQTLSSAKLNCYLAEWAVLTEKAENESFNASDGCPFTWGKFWPKFAERFGGMGWTGPPEDDDGRYKEAVTPYSPPPRGFGPPAKIRYTFTLTEWAKRPEVQRAWAEIAQRNNLREREMEDMDIDRVFGFTDAAMMWSYPISFNMSKARRFGFFGMVDSVESVFAVFEEFAGLGMVPEIPAAGKK